MKGIAILGSTGSIGTQSLKIIDEFKGYKVVSLACDKNINLIDKQIEIYKPKYVYTSKKCAELENKYKEVKFYSGNDIKELINKDEVDVVLNSMVGSSGFIPTLEALMNHKKVLLSNKETLVIGGEIVKEYLKKYNGTLYPIDSEHTALWELIEQYKDEISEYTITASGGPFRDYSKEDLENVTVEDALKHPNWKMGNKITIDSSTLMNKGFEVIEAHYLFDIPVDKIKTIINYESNVHAYVKLKNDEIKYGINETSMRNPIIRALYYPEIKYKNVMYDKYTFKEIDHDKFKCLDLAIEAIKKGGLYPTVLNAANEAAVSLFLNGKIKYTDIYKLCLKAINEFKSDDLLTIENILKHDRIVKENIINLYR